jgi:hypothetical protein
MSQVPGRKKSLASQVAVNMVEQTSPEKGDTEVCLMSLLLALIFFLFYFHVQNYQNQTIIEGFNKISVMISPAIFINLNWQPS